MPRPEAAPAIDAAPVLAAADRPADIDGIGIRGLGDASGAATRPTGRSATLDRPSPRAFGTSQRPPQVPNPVASPRNSNGVDIGPAKGSAARDADRPTGPDTGRALVIGCGALARELLEVTRRIPGLEVACLPPDLHNRPDGIPGAVRARIAEARHDGFERIFVAYADCGTGGLLEPVLAEAGVERLPGAHCYEVFAGSAEFAALADAEPGTFWLTDFLARNFERLVIRGLGIDRHPELQATYFAHYERVVYLSQTDDPDLLVLARRAAERLGLAFEHRPTGIGHFAAPILAFAERDAGARATAGSADASSRGAGVSDEITAVGGPDAPKSEADAHPAGILGTFRGDRVASARGAGSPGIPRSDRVASARRAGTARPVARPSSGGAS